MLSLASTLLMSLMTAPAWAGPPTGPYSASGPVSAYQQPTAKRTPFTWVAEPTALIPGVQSNVALRVTVPKDHAVYRDQVSVRVLYDGGLEVQSVSLPQGVKVRDESRGGQVREQYDMDFVIHLPVRAVDVEPGLVHMRLEVRQQGCRLGACYPPETELLVVTVPVREAPSVATSGAK